VWPRQLEDAHGHLLGINLQEGERQRAAPALVAAHVPGVDADRAVAPPDLGDVGVAEEEDVRLAAADDGFRLDVVGSIVVVGLGGVSEEDPPSGDLDELPVAHVGIGVIDGVPRARDPREGIACLLQHVGIVVVIAEVDDPVHPDALQISHDTPDRVAIVMGVGNHHDLLHEVSALSPGRHRLRVKVKKPAGV
jgi:hypothetical protein